MPHQFRQKRCLMTIPAGSDIEQAYQDTDLLLRIAQAVMVSGETRGIPLRDRVDAEGQHHKDTLELDGRTVWRPVVDLVAEGEPYMVAVAEDLLVLDADNLEQVATLQEMARRLELDEHRHVIVRSGSPGHRQLWARVGRGYRAQLEAELRRLPSGCPDLRRCRMVRPPLSPHPAGYPVELVGVGLTEALSILQFSPGLVDRLGATARAALETGVSRGADPTRSSVQFSVLKGCVVAGFTDVEVGHLFSQDYPGTLKYRRHVHRNPDGAWRALLQDFRRARAKTSADVVVDDPHSARVALSIVAAHIAAEPWGPGDENLQAVLEAHLHIARRAGKTSGHHASRHELADLTGLSVRTVARINARGVAAGWLLQLEQHTATKAATWAFAYARRSAPPTQHTGRGVCYRWGATARPPWSADIWRPAGLGHKACRVWLTLSSEPVMPAELADRLNYKSAGPIRRHLRRLEAVGLAEHTEYGWVLGPDTPVDAAETARCTGESEWYRKQDRRIRQRWERRRPRKDERPLFVLQPAPLPPIRLPRGPYAYAWGFRTVTEYDDQGNLVALDVPAPPVPSRYHAAAA